MCWPWNHSWEKIDEKQTRLFEHDRDELPTKIIRCILLKCKTCGLYKQQKFKIT